MTQNNLLCDNEHMVAPEDAAVHSFWTLEAAAMTKMLDGWGVDVTYMDFRKAFDCVPHCRLLRDFGAYGITGKVFQGLPNGMRAEGLDKWRRVFFV